MLGATSDVTVDVSVLERVHDILVHYTEEDIRRADNAAAAYFQWVRLRYPFRGVATHNLKCWAAVTRV